MEKVHGTTWHTYSGTGITPHSATQRVTTTVGTDVKAIVRYLSVTVIRTSAATTVGESRIYVTVTPSGSSEVVVHISGMNSNSVGARAGANISDSIVLMPGDVISVYTSDASTGGTCDYMIAFELVYWR